jgi:hypothetical protein
VKTGKDHYALLVGMCLVPMLTGAVVRAQQAQQRSPAQESQMQQAPRDAELLHVLAGQSLEVSSPARIKRISVSDPGIIDAVVEDPNHIQINGRTPGGTTLVVWDETDQSQIFYVYVTLNDPGLAGQLSAALPANPPPVPVQKKVKTWLVWVVIASVMLLAGAVLRVRRRREPYIYKFDLQAAKMGSPNGNGEPGLAAPDPARAEEHPAKAPFTDGAARQAEDLEKTARGLGEWWSLQLQEQAEAAAERLREEVKNSERVVEESMQQLASLVEAKLALLSQATREEYGQQLAQALGEQAQAMHAAAEGEVRSIRQAAEEAMAELQAAERRREESYLARVEAAEERLAGVPRAVEALAGRVGALVEEFPGKQAKQAEELGGRWSQQFQEQAEAAVERLREEVKNSGRVVEESKQQLASLAEAKLASISQFAANAAARLEAEYKRKKNQYETSRRELDDLAAIRSAKLAYTSLQRGRSANRRGIVAQLALVAAGFLVMAASLLGVYLWTAPVMQLQPEAPAEFIDQSPGWSAKRRVREAEMAQAYWRVATVSLQEKYPFGSELPAEPPTEFQIDKKYVPAGGAKASSEIRAHYWERLRRCWVQPQSWVERHKGNTRWAARLWQIWDQSLRR